MKILPWGNLRGGGLPLDITYNVAGGLLFYSGSLSVGFTVCEQVEKIMHLSLD